MRALGMAMLLSLLVLPAGDRAAGQPCVCDCDGDGRLAVEDVVACVGVAASAEPAVGGCPAGDADGDGRILVHELVGAVGHLQRGDCPLSPTPTPAAIPDEIDFDLRLRSGPELPLMPPGSYTLTVRGKLTMHLEPGPDRIAVEIPRDAIHFAPLDLRGLGLRDFQWSCTEAAAAGGGWIDCDGGSAGIDLQIEQDHNTTPAATCVRGPHAGETCDTDADCEAGPCNESNGGGRLDDTECTAESTFAGEATQACREGNACNPGPHEGVCNGPVTITAAGTALRGDARLTLPLVSKVLGENDLGPDGQPCTEDDDGEPLDEQVLHLTTGAAHARIVDANNVAGDESAGYARGIRFDCTRLSAGATLATILPVLDVDRLGDLLLPRYLQMEEKSGDRSQESE